MWATSNVKVSLNIHGRNLDPDRVSRLLGIDPDKKFSRGERGTNDGQPVPPQGHWGISTEGSLDPSAPVDAHIRLLLGRITADRAIWAQLSEAFRCRIFVGWFLEGPNEMVELDPELLAELAERRLPLVLDVYAQNGTEEEDSAL